MNKRLRAVIRGTGMAVPAEVLTNEFFASYLDTSDEWITTRSGIKERHRVGPGESTGTLARTASEQALKEAGLTASELDLIILATVFPDTLVPSGASWLQAALGATNVPCMDINAACSGLMYGLVQAGMFIESGMYRNVLLVGAETLTRLTDYEDRGTCILFGDGAAAIVLSATDDPERGILYHELGADGRGAELIAMPAGGSRLPASTMTVNERLHCIRMRGREVYKFAVNKFDELVERTLRVSGYKPDDLSLLVPHQSNLRIIESARDRLRLPAEKVMVNIHKYGNTSSASAGMALHEARQAGRLKEGDLMLTVAFGAGLTWGVILMRM